MEGLPRSVDGAWCWSLSRAGVEARFVGKGAGTGLEAALTRLLPEAVEPSWLKQVHSARVLEARPGLSGEGDALITPRRRLALAVVTADCVPVLMAADGRVAAVHAGWRGIAQRIVPAAVERLRSAPAGVVAWIGPAIGACCYEVGEEVAERVAAASAADVVLAGRRGRPHLDLVRAVAGQLRRAGVEEIHRVDACTRCDAERLWSYRREGPGAGRNLALVWRA